jgi:transposase
MPSDYNAIAEMLTPFRSRIARVVYEAGCTGFGLARTLKRSGIKVDVVAPGKTPRPPARSSKSDRVDANKLAEYSAKDLLQAVAIPSETREADRQLVRLREQLVSRRRRIKNNIKSFLMNYSIKEPDGLKYWSNVSVEALRHLELRPHLRFAMDSMLDELAHVKSQVLRVTKEIRLLSQTERYSSGIALLRSHPGVGEITSIAFLTEVYRSGRFSNARQVSCYVGLAPMVRSSGETRREGSILKTGRGYVRALLVEAAWTWVYRDKGAKKVYRRLVSNTGNAKKAIVAMARRLTVNLWTMLSNDESYRAPA